MKNSHLDRRSKYSIQAIRTALFRLLKEKELPSITVTEICRLADTGELFTNITRMFPTCMHRSKHLLRKKAI